MKQLNDLPSRRLRVAAWNVGHQTRRRNMPIELATALGSLNCGVIILTEYVADDSHAGFLQVLSDSGLSHIATSPYVRGQNQVLIVSRWELISGNVFLPDITPATRLNWLHTRLTGSSCEFVGIRVPMFKRPSDRLAYWDWLESALPAFNGSNTMIVGDLNVYPMRSRSVGRGPRCSHRCDRLADSIPRDWLEFYGETGADVGIDHGIVSPMLRIASSEYVTDAAGCRFAGPGAYSDHAVLVVDVHVPDRRAVG